MKIILIILCSCFSLSAFAQEKTTLSSEQIKNYTQSFDLIKKSYIKPVPDQVLIENSIKGMLSSLDPHSSYLSEEDLEQLQATTQGHFGGLGIEVARQHNYIKVISPIDDTPAQQAGIKAGDLITQINGQSSKGMELIEAIKLMRGKPGSKIKLTIFRNQTGQSLDFHITRAIIKVDSVKQRLLSPHYGYIRIARFQANTAKELTKALARLARQSAPLAGLVLDLRNNPGGTLESAVQVSDFFLGDGLIVYTKGRVSDANMRFHANKTNTFNAGLPIVVLINGGSASAAEIVAGALQDHKRAVIMGTPSFGKGSVQSIIPLDNKKAIKLTTALYYTPKGRSIQAEGIKPDILVEALQFTLAKEGPSTKEANLPGHLSQNKSATTNDPLKSENDELINRDFQLYEAVNLLKGLNALKKDPLDS
jgi:carboxyl-terminal processing protease